MCAEARGPRQCLFQGGVEFVVFDVQISVGAQSARMQVAVETHRRSGLLL
jgi:hypothetical protein